MRCWLTFAINVLTKNACKCKKIYTYIYEDSGIPDW